MGAHDAAIHGGHADLPHEEHPGERTYVEVAIALAIITAVEVAVYYIATLRGVLVPVLIVLSVVKFIAVVGYFMHLKFDDKRFLIIFAGGLAISLSVVLALVLIMQTGEFYCPGLPAEGQTVLLEDRC
jgi:cytochrome c oxidase subunit 4